MNKIHQANGKGTEARTRLAWVMGALFLIPGCVSYHVYEIDAANAQRFNWNGKIRLTERTQHGFRLFRGFTEDTELIRVELASDENRNVIMEPSKEVKSELPSARLCDIGRPPDQVLSLVVSCSPLHRQVARHIRDDVPVSEKEAEAMSQMVHEYQQTVAHARSREFDQITGGQLALACADQGTPVESTCRLDSDTIVRLSLADGNVLTVLVEDAQGNPLYRFEPQELNVVEVKETNP